MAEHEDSRAPDETSFVTIYFRGPKDAGIRAIDFSNVGGAHFSEAALVLGQIAIGVAGPFIVKTLKQIEGSQIVLGRRVL